MKLNRVLLVGITLGAIAVSAFAYFDYRRVTVESEDGRYRSRSVDTRGGVRLVRKLSDAPCIYGRSWGYDRNRIWVDNGCRATFSVGDGNGDGRDWDRDGNRDRDRDWNRDRDRDRDRGRDDCPTWLPGRYNGYEDGNRVSFQIDIGGGVTFRRDRGGRWDNDERGYYRDNCIYVGNRVYEVSRFDSGIRMRNKDRRFDLRRQ